MPSQLIHHTDNDGLTTITKMVDATTISVSYQLDNRIQQLSKTHPEVIEHKLAQKLAAAILSSGIPTMHRHVDHLTFNEIIGTSITICKPSVKFKHVEGDSFVVNGEHFNEDEIIFALKQTYPDRLI